MTKEQAYKASKFLNIAGIPNTIERQNDGYIIVFTIYSSKDIRQEVILSEEGFDVRSIEDGNIWIEKSFLFGDDVDPIH